MTTRENLATIAEIEATIPYHGYVMSLDSNITEIIEPFPKWSLKKADKKWCAAFVYYCCNKAGYNLPVRSENPKMKYNFAGCLGWEQWAQLEENQFYISVNDEEFSPTRGDIILFDNVFDPGSHDHIGIIVDPDKDNITVAEGNVNNISTVLKRPKSKNLRGLIRLPERWSYGSKGIIKQELFVH